MPDRHKSPPLPVKLYVLVDNRLLRETLVRLFRKRSDLSVVGQNSHTGLALQEAAATQPDVLLSDFLLPDHKLSAMLGNLRESSPRTNVVMLGTDEGEEVFLQAVRLGVKGYLLRSVSSAELLLAVRAVAQGEAVCPACFCKTLFQSISSEWAQKTAIAAEQVKVRFELTRRQQELMSLVALGLSNKEIAANLNLSEFTVKNHIYRVMKQVDAPSRQEAVKLLRASQPQNYWQKPAMKSNAYHAS